MVINKYPASILRLFSITALSVLISFGMNGCATVSTPSQEVEAPVSREASQAAQKIIQQPIEKTLKRKLAIGRFSNETRYGRTLWRDGDLDPLGKQVSDILASRLIESGKFMVFERPDISKIEREQQVASADSDLIGVDALILGSLTEFGRSNTGKSGFLSKTKLQTARAVVEIRLVDVHTGYAFFAASGAGEAQMESGEIAGFGSKADYDATLNDKAISAAISDVISELMDKLDERAWRTDILEVDQNQIFISGGERQGLNIGDRLRVMSEGRTIKSQQTGFDIALPATEVAKIEIQSFFGESEINEGSVAKLVAGELPDNIDKLFITEE